jgi:hypothetical protein
LEPEALVRTQGERAVRKPNCGHHRRGLGELREADFHFPSLAIIAIPTYAHLYATKRALYRKYGSATLAA